MSENKKVISTTIPVEIYDLAKRNRIRWTDALIMGVEALSSEYGGEDVLTKDLTATNAKKKLLESRLENLKEVKSQLIKNIDDPEEKMKRSASAFDSRYGRTGNAFDPDPSFIHAQKNAHGLTIEDVFLAIKKYSKCSISDEDIGRWKKEYKEVIG